jgi:phosphoesterase RecJ-like protein
VLILFHESPDGDAIASSLALAEVLRCLGKKVDLVCRDEMPAVFDFLPGIHLVGNDFILADYDTICTLDCGDTNRTGFPVRVKKFAQTKKRLINIDHHLKNDLHKIANLNFIDSQAVATAELIYNLINELNIKIDKNLATLLLTGIFTDTGGFQHSNTTPAVYHLASKLLAKGAQLRRLSSRITLSKSLVSLKLWGVALTRIWRTDSGVVASLVTQQDLAEIGAKDEDIAGVVNIINSIPKTRVTILFQEMSDGKIKASLRTEEEVNVAVLAGIFGGGGHRKAAGFTVDGTMTPLANGSWRIKIA